MQPGPACLRSKAAGGVLIPLTLGDPILLLPLLEEGASLGVEVRLRSLTSASKRPRLRRSLTPNDLPPIWLPLL